MRLLRPRRPRPRRSALAALTASAALATLAATALTAGPAAASPGTKDVSYHGYHVRVPANWPVIDLTAHPAACVRLDRDAVYLGHPTDAGQATCPAHLVGRADALLLEPLDATTRRLTDRHTAVAAPGKAAAPTLRDPGAPAGQIREAVPAAGVLATASYGTDATAVQAVLAGARLDGSARADAAPAATADAVAPLTAGVPAQPGAYTGKGFDPCSAPSTSQMNAWTASPYQAVGVYIGGVSAACAQPNLTASWVSTETAAGWHIIPIEVDLQAPCTTFSHRVSSTLSTASAQGTATADDAVSKASALGLPTGSTLYDDMEGYDRTNSGCSQAVLTFLSAWTVELHAHGYLSGVYSSLGSGISDLGAQYTTGTYTLPDNIWFAWWNGAADTNTGSYVPAADWADHQRLHQYSGDTDETWGGVTINVDDDYLDVGGGSVGTCSASLDFTAYPAISSGSTGGPVSAAQCLLLRQGYFTGSVNGSFGSDTASAVTAFQTAKGLSATGTVDSHTWTALLSAGSQPTLQNGSTGVDVQRLQRALTAALGQTVGIDGDFGPQTTSAVKSYQSSRGLSSDGVVGPLTWGALQSGK